MKKKRGLLLGLGVMIVLSASILYGCRDLIITDPVDITQSNWDIEMPKGAKQIFYESSEVSFLGDGEKYSVYECEDENSIRNSFDWQDDKSKLMSEGFKTIIHKIRAYEGTEIPDEYVPDLTGEFLYYYKKLEDNSKIYIIYVPGESKIYISEDIL